MLHTIQYVQHNIMNQLQLTGIDSTKYNIQDYHWYVLIARINLYKGDIYNFYHCLSRNFNPCPSTSCQATL